MIDFTALASARVALLRSTRPRILILSGASSQEDREYFSRTPAELLSQFDLRGSLSRLGADRVRLVDVVSTSDWPKHLSKDTLVIVNLHGQPGEDGSIQGLLETLQIPFVGAGVEASAIALNKVVTKLMARAVDVPTPKYAVIGEGWLPDTPALLGERICKPIRGGSSIGVRRLTTGENAPTTGGFLLEKFLEGLDVTVTVVDGHEGPVALPAVILHHSHAFYDAQCKLSGDESLSAIAGRPSEYHEILVQCEEMALRMHEVIGARHISRSDFVLNEDKAYFLELNTLPGLSARSNCAQSAYAAGLTYDQFIALVVGASLRSE